MPETGGDSGPTPPPLDDPSSPPGGNPGGNPGGGGSGGYTPSYEWSEQGQGFFPSRPPARIGGRAPEGDWSPQSNTYRYNGRCDGNFSWTANGTTYSEPYAGWRWYLAGVNVLPFQDPNNPNGTDGIYYQRTALAGSYECIDPPKYYQYTVKCAARGSAYLIGPIFNSDQTATGPRSNLPSKTSAFEQGGRDDPSLCNQSYTFPFGRSPTAWGQYKMVGTAFYRECEIRTYYTVDPRTGRVPSSEVRSCSGVQPDSVDVAYLEIFCEPPYVHKTWHNGHSFTAEDCADGATWTCGPEIALKPTFDGRSGGPFEVLDDGVERPASWRTPTPSGDLRRLRNRSTTLNYREGSPFRTGDVKNGTAQPFFTFPKNEVSTNGWRAGAPSSSNRTAWDLTFLAPGQAGEPWTARPRWDFSAQFKSYVPNITWNLYNNSYTYTLEPVWVRADAQCRGLPVEIDVSRARNSSE